MADETHITEPMMPTSTVFSEMLRKQIERELGLRVEMTPEEVEMAAFMAFLNRSEGG